MKTVTYDETKWAMVPIEPTSKQLADTAFNLCSICEHGHSFVSENEKFARDVYSEMIANAPTPPDWEPSFHGNEPWQQ